MEEKVVDELVKIGFRRYYKGFTYLKEIICIIKNKNIIYNFNLRSIYIEIAEKHGVSICAVKGDIIYLIRTMDLNDVSRRKLLNYTEFKEMSDVSSKKLIEVILDRLFPL